MKKSFTILFALSLFIVACSSNSDHNNANNANDQTTENGENNEPKPLETEVLFSYDHEESGDYEIQSIQIDAAGQAITFTGKEDIDRKKEYFTYVVDQNDHVFEGLELAEDKNQDRRCTDMYVSPNGEYLVYDCHDDGIAFSVYDMNEEETIHQMEEPDSYIKDIYGISNDKVVYYEIENDDYETELVLYDAEADAGTHYVLKDLFDTEEEPSFDRIIQSDDGQYLLITAFTELYLFDTEAKSAKEIVTVDPHVEEHDTDIFIYNVKMSPDATYVYYEISENEMDPVYKEHFFHNLDNDEVTAFSELDYASV